MMTVISPDDGDEKSKYILNEDQKKFIRENYDKIKIKELAQQVWNDPKQTGQTHGGLTIRKYIASEEFQNELPGARVKTTKYVKGDNAEYELSPDHKLLIRNNLGKMQWMEMARLAFNNSALTPLHAEAKAVYKYCVEIDPGSIPDDEKLTEEEQYKPPTSIDRLVTRVNKYRFRFTGDKSRVLDRNDLRQGDMRNLQSLLGYMYTERFVQQCSKYTREADRNLFESSFVRFCYEKPDLLEEEVDNYVSLCSEIVTITQIERIIQLMDNQLEEALRGNGEEKKLTMTFNESINNQRDKLNQAKKTYQSLMDKLVGARSKRLEDKIQQNASILNLVEAWKNEEKRKELIALAEMEKKADEGEVGRLNSLDSVIALIAGISKREGTM